MHYNVLAQLKHAIAARKEKYLMPFSKMDFAVLQSLATAGYIKSAEKEMIGKKAFISVRVGLKGKTGNIEFKIASKPSRHFYKDYRSLRPVKQGHGIAVLSTSKGIMTDREARKNKVGGEYLFEIW